MTGEIGFSQVFFGQRSKVPADHLVGEEGGGWAVARTTLGFERATAFLAQRYSFLGRIYERLDRDGTSGGDRGPRRDDIVRGWIEVRTSSG